jgi:hypothetical protein
MSDQEYEPALPLWYYNIYPNGKFTGFYHNLGNHVVNYVDSGSNRLVITFDNLAEAGGRHYDRDAWAAKFIAGNGWNHLGVMASGPTWFRDAKLIDLLEGLKSDGFFANFDHVALSGSSMGGFGAMTFASLAPGSTVVAFSPQITLNNQILPWERRFPKGRRQDWTLPYSDARDGISAAAKVYAVYDPFQPTDTRHIDMITTSNLIRLKAFGMGHRTSLVLRRMNQIKSVMYAGVTGSLEAPEFYKMIRSRKSIFVYRQTMEHYLVERGQAERAQRFVEAFRRLRQNQK